MLKDRNINLNFKLDALPKPTIRRLRGLLSPRFSTSIETAVISDAQAVRLIRPTEPVTRVGRTSEAESSGSRPRISGRLVSNVQNKGRTVFGISKRDRSDNATSRSRPTRTPPEDTDEINSDPINQDAAPNRMFRLRSRLNLATNVIKLTQHEEGPPMLFSDLVRIETQNMLYIYSCFAELASLKFPGRTIFDNLEYLMEEGRALAKYRDALEGSELLNIIDSEANQETGTTNGVRAFFIKHTKPSGLKEIVVAFHTPRYSTSNKLWKKTVKYRGKKDKDTKNRTKVLQGLIPGNLAKEKDKGNINGEKTEKKESAGHIDKVYWSWYLSIAKFALRELMASIEIMKERGTPPCDITVTGYKDAAALAILFMADIHSVKNNLLRLAVFSTPRFGDAAFSEYYNKLFPRYNGVSNRYFEYSAIIPEDSKFFLVLSYAIFALT